MDARQEIDITFDFRTDTPQGKDPDGPFGRFRLARLLRPDVAESK
jgi:hypothetical protein